MLEFPIKLKDLIMITNAVREWGRKSIRVTTCHSVALGNVRHPLERAPRCSPIHGWAPSSGSRTEDRSLGAVFPSSEAAARPGRVGSTGHWKPVRKGKPFPAGGSQAEPYRTGEDQGSGHFPYTREKLVLFWVVSEAGYWVSSAQKAWHLFAINNTMMVRNNPFIWTLKGKDCWE